MDSLACDNVTFTERFVAPNFRQLLYAGRLVYEVSMDAAWSIRGASIAGVANRCGSRVLSWIERCSTLPPIQAESREILLGLKMAQ